MIKEHLILCGGTDITSQKDVSIHRLQLGKGKGMICLGVESITQKMVQDLPDVMHDLLEIATYVYSGDQMISRGGSKSFDYGEKWVRCLNFKIPVREYDIWSDPTTKELLEEILSFASGDTYHFSFVKHRTTDFTNFLNFNTEVPPGNEYDRILLFSGGLDSFTGAIDEIVTNKSKIVLVSHQSNNKLKGLQRKLHEYLVSLINSGPKPFHIPVVINKDKRLTQETSQRTRSFLYGTLGTIIATMFKKNSVKFYENGIVSCNLPFDEQTLQARSTRSTHPKLLHLLSLFISKLTNSDFHFENPYFSKTKTDVVERLLELHHQKCIENTRSCAKSIYRKPHTHCGTCSQCIDRRFATLAGQCQKYDPDQLYNIDIFKEELCNIYDRTMAVGFVGFANSLENMTIESFIQKFSSDVYTIARYISNTKYEDSLKQLFDLHYRHAAKVNKVMEAKCTENISLVRKGILPDDCLINMVLQGKHRNMGKILEKEISFRQDENGTIFITGHENEILEFKETLQYSVKTKQIDKEVLNSSLKTIAAFLNTNGGTLLIGVSDAGEIKGIERDKQAMGRVNNDKYELKIRNFISGQNSRFKPAALGNINISFNNLHKFTICRVDVKKLPKSEIIHFDNDIYIRNGNQTIKLEGPDLTNWIKQRQK